MSTDSTPQEIPPAPDAEPTPADTQRFFGLDAVRAVAMLLGVLYHAILFGGGMMGPPGAQGGLAPVLMNWIHSFRMPLFFLISGFFSHMMLGKYGPGRYLVRRWTRIGVPFLMVLFVLAAIRTWGPQDRGPFGGPGGPGGPGRPAGPGGPGPGRFEPAGGPPPGGRGPGIDGGEFPPPPPGFVPPFLERFDTDHDGSLSPEEWKKAQESFRSEGPRGSRPGGPPGFGAPNPIAERLFGSASRNFNFAHLWFLWHILVYTTAALPVGWLLGRLGALNPEAWGLAGAWLMRYGLAPLSLAVVSLGGLYLSGSQPGQPPSGFQSILGVFPDTFFRWDRDWPYFFSYFMWGWWLFSQRAGLSDVGRLWLPTLVVGFVAYNGLRILPESGPFGPPRGQELSGLARLGGFLLFATAAAHTALGLLGFFQRFLNRPNPVTRYLADTAFWIYLVHQDLIQGPVLGWVRPWKLPAMAQALMVVGITVLIALVAFELVIRRTPLTTLFGPPRKKRPTASAG